ncbi:MAG: hypothetical protein VW475_06905 [Curvibacter sp.]
MKLISTQALDSDLVYAPGSLYQKKYRHFVRREGPDGQRGRHLWIVIEKYNEHVSLKGYKHRIPADHPLAIEVLQ